MWKPDEDIREATVSGDWKQIMAFPVRGTSVGAQAENRRLCPEIRRFPSVSGLISQGFPFIYTARCWKVETLGKHKENLSFPEPLNTPETTNKLEVHNQVFTPFLLLKPPSRPSCGASDKGGILLMHLPLLYNACNPPLTHDIRDML